MTPRSRSLAIPRSTAARFFVALLLAFGCAHRSGSLVGPLQAARHEAGRDGAKARSLALAGFFAYLVEGRPAEAQALWERALSKEPAEPYALYGHYLLAKRGADTERALSAALELCERAPRHPLAAVGARFVLESVGTSALLDRKLLGRAEAALGQADGDAAFLLRAAKVRVLERLGPPEAREAAAREVGQVRSYRVDGPISAFESLDFDELASAERTGAFGGGRKLDFPDGRAALFGELLAAGDGYLLGADFEVVAEGVYVVRAVSPNSFRLTLDGTALFERRNFERESSSVRAQGVLLTPGRHRLVVRLSREGHTGSLAVAVARADGRPSGLTFSPAEGAAASWGGVKKVENARSFPGAAELASAMVDEVGELLSVFIAAEDAVTRDTDGAKALLSRLASEKLGPAISWLRAELALSDRTVGGSLARGRATRDLEQASGDVLSLLQRANLALEEERTAEALELVQLARAARTPAGPQVLLLKARVELALGLDAVAEQSAREAEKGQGGLCEGLALRYDLARKRDAAAQSDFLARELAPCPGGLARLAEHARARGDLEQALLLFERWAAAEPSSPTVAAALARLYVAARRFDRAEAVLLEQARKWPNDANLAKELGNVLEYWGKPKEAHKARERALLLDGDDLALRRQVERERTGKELLEEFAIDGKEAIAAYEKQRGAEDVASTYVLDAAAVRVYPDGAMVDRVHVIQKALDPDGVSRIAEVTIPQGAKVLTLRTVKQDGSTLEPERIEEKETVSLPGVQVGDFVEHEYLLAHAPRSKAQPGFTAQNFYFQILNEPNYRSMYTVVAPRRLNMSVDAHNMKADPVEVRGDEAIFSHEERQVPPLIPEPDSPPSGNEVLPFVSVGAGTLGDEGELSEYADLTLKGSKRTFEVEEFARAAAGKKTGREAVEAVFAQVMERLLGKDSGRDNASQSLAQGRGSRLYLLKAALEALGFPTRVVAVRTFAVDPAPYRFPSEALWPYACLRTTLPDGKVVWMDTSIRFGPFGELPEGASDREAVVLPEPGRPLERLRTPPGGGPSGKDVVLKVELSADGRLTGEGEEVYRGFEAAQLTEALDALSPEQRNQALQGALSRYFGGAELSRLELDLRRTPGAPLSVRYGFTAPRFARVEGEKLVLGALTFPAMLGRRFVQLGQRRMPLYVESSEALHSRVWLKLPKGYRLRSPLPEVSLAGPSGRFHRSERDENGQVAVDEEYRLDMSRIPPEKYDDFAQFAGEVDLVQSRDLVVERR